MGWVPSEGERTTRGIRGDCVGRCDGAGAIVDPDDNDQSPESDREERGIGITGGFKEEDIEAALEALEALEALAAARLGGLGVLFLWPDPPDPPS